MGGNGIMKKKQGGEYMEDIKLENLGKEVVVGDSSLTLRQKLTKSCKTIPFSSIVSVQVKKPGLIAGYIYFQTVGGLDNKIKTPNEISKDENSLIINGKGKYEVALKIKERIEKYKMQPSIVSVNANSSADEIIKYKQLFDAGVITQEEFEAKKKQLLNL